MAGENLDLIGALADLEQERGIDRETLLAAVEAALISAYRRNYGTTENVGVRIDRDNGQMDIYVQKRIVDEVDDPEQEIGIADARAYDPSYQTGDIIEFPVLVKDFGRIAAQTAKQVVVQRIREAERGMIFDEYVQREGDIITGVVQRVQGRTAFIDLGRTEAVLPAAEVPPGEYYNPGDRVKVYLVEVRRTSKGPQLLVSRTHPGLLKRLFELEVPEIHDGLVEVKGIAREAGARSKFAVFSREDHIDPVGACVGHKGMRVQAVVNELRGEKIDIIKWSPEPVEYVANALSPSKVSQVLLREDEKVARVIVPDYQLSLAIGRAGQNARLAAKLTGWRIDIRSESQVLEEGGELTPAGVGSATPAVPWAGVGQFDGAGVGRGGAIAAPWAVPGPEAEGAEGEAAVPAGDLDDAGAYPEMGGVQAADGQESPDDAGADLEAADAAAGVPGMPEGAMPEGGDAAGAGDAAGQAADAAGGLTAAGALQAGAEGTGPESAAAPAGPARARSRRVTMPPVTERGKPKKKAQPKVREQSKVIHAASLAEALAQAGLSQGEGAGDAAATGEPGPGARTDGADSAARAEGTEPGGGEPGGGDGEGGSRGHGRAAAGRRGRGRAAAEGVADEAPADTQLDEDTIEALEEKAAPASARRARRTRRTRDEGTPLAREEE